MHLDGLRCKAGLGLRRLPSHEPVVVLARARRAGGSRPECPRSSRHRPQAPGREDRRKYQGVGLPWQGPATSSTCVRHRLGVGVVVRLRRPRDPRLPGDLGMGDDCRRAWTLARCPTGYLLPRIDRLWLHRRTVWPRLREREQAAEIAVETRRYPRCMATKLKRVRLLETAASLVIAVAAIVGVILLAIADLSAGRAFVGFAVVTLWIPMLLRKRRVEVGP